MWNGWSTAAVVAGGVLCALLIGVLAVRRSRVRSEQFAVAGVFTALFTVLVALGGLSSNGSGGLGMMGGGHVTLGTSLPAALGFCLLWAFGGVLVGPYVARVLGVRPAPVGGPQPFMPPRQAAPGPQPYVPPRQAAPPAPPFTTSASWSRTGSKRRARATSDPPSGPVRPPFRESRRRARGGVLIDSYPSRIAARIWHPAAPRRNGRVPP